jgi:PKD repeat protein
MLSKASVIVFVLSLFLLGGCQTYTNLYGNQNASTQFVPDSSIKVAESDVGIVSEVTDDDSLTPEAKALAEELAKKIEANQEESTPVSEEEAQESPKAKETPVTEVTEEPTSDEGAISIIAQETQMVSLQPQASDPDGDTLIFAFTSPLDENGKWQTTYGDAGEYTVTVTASDGDLTTTQDVLVIVNKKEEAPSIDASSPEDSSVETQETKMVTFTVSATDLNKDALSYEWKLDGEIVGSDPEYEYQTTYDDSGSHTVKVDVSDSVSSASKIWAVNVGNLNRKPVLDAFDAISAKEADVITIIASATDADSDEVEFSIDDERFTQDGNEFVWNTDYSSAGTYTVTITASDGEDEVSQDVAITVANVNRKPVILGITQK